MVMGFPSAGKSSVAKLYTDQGFVYLNRDKAGGKVIDLVPRMVAAMKDGKDVVLDNTFPTVESRRPFVAAAKANDIAVVCDWLTATIEDAQFVGGDPREDHGGYSRGVQHATGHREDA